MGGGSWTDSSYHDRVTTRAVTGTPTFDYSSKVSSGHAPRAAHVTMSPTAVAGAKSPFVGSVMRESRDSVDHPESLAIGVIFDVTGSMGVIPQILQTKLAGLMKLLIAKGYVAHPQILFGAIGDANSDSVPLQIGQFESDITMEDNLTNIFLEGGGGGQIRETYELAHYFFARHTSVDCFEKRGKKGYFFTIGDEGFYDRIRKEQVKSLIGDNLEAHLDTKQIFDELKEKYNVFHIIAEQGSYPHNKEIETQWRDQLGERVLLLEDSNNIAELIGMTIGLCEGTIDIDDGSEDLLSIGVDKKAIDSIRGALIPLASAGVLSKAGTASNLPDVANNAGGVTRL
jgi:hypothetical protein